MRSKHLAWKAWSPTASTSSISRTRDPCEGHGKRQAHDHAGRIGAQRLADEVADTGEVHDLVRSLAAGAGSVPVREAFTRTFSPPVRSRWNPEPSSSNAATRPFTVTVPAVRPGQPRHQSQQGAFAGPVRPYHRQAFALLDREGDVFQRKETFLALPPEELEDTMATVGPRAS